MSKLAISEQATFNREAALRDWREAVDLAQGAGRYDLVRKRSFDPRNARWTEIDAHTKELLEDLRAGADTQPATLTIFDDEEGL